MERFLLFLLIPGIFLLLFCSACNSSKTKHDHSYPNDKTSKEFTGANNEVRLITLDPGHFHAYLVQKYPYDRVDSVVHVFAPKGYDVQRYLQAIKQFNAREDNPTNWHEKVYTGSDYLQEMVTQKPGNVVIIAGNNAKKTKYIKSSIDAGLNVLADKPMVIKREKFPMLVQAFKTAQKKGLLLYDIMTLRYAITTILQKKLSEFPKLFGKLEKGTPDNPAMIQKSTHRFFKQVAGQPLIRPAWFFDRDQKGEAIVDVSTHLVDLIMTQAFPNTVIDTTDVKVLNARHWTSDLSPKQFEQVTGMKTYPDYLQENITQDSVLRVYSNGEFTFQICDINAKVSVLWDYGNPNGGDTHYSLMRGTKANLVIKQGKKQNYEPTLYIEPTKKENKNNIESEVKTAVEVINEQYPGVSVSPASEGWQVKIPEKYRIGHEAHFAQVMKKYFQYLTKGELPDWERQNMITKYYLTTRAYELSQ